MLWKTAFAASVLAAQAQAGVLAVDGAEVGGRMLAARGAALGLDQSLARAAAGAAAAAGSHALVQRDTANTTAAATTDAGSGIVLNSNGTINMTAWDDAVTAACTAVLTKLPVSSNPSGTCTCYNLPALNNATGAFEADLRLYQLSTATGAFSGIAPENIQVGLSYAAASVSPVSANTAQKLVVSRADTAANGSLRLLQQYYFVGQISKAALAPNMNMAQLEALVMPTVTLTGLDSSGQTVATNVSTNEAAFVAGIFSQAVIMSNATLAQAAVNDVVNGLHNGTVAFVLPGVQIMLFPIGLVITSVWLVVGVSVIGLGLVDRIGFRHIYRQRTVQSIKSSKSRI